MKSRARIGSLVVVLLSACSWSGHKRHDAPNPAEIIVNGAPVESIVFVDGAQAGQPVQHGRTPQILDVSPGDHTVEIHLGDRVVYREAVYVPAGEHYMVSVLSGWNR